MSAADDRRIRVLAAVIAITDHTARCMGGAQPVRDFHVRYFGLPSCVDASQPTIRRDLLWLEARGYVSRPNRRLAEFAPTDDGRARAAVAAEGSRP